MLLFGDMRNDIPLVDFAQVVEETVIIYTTTPESILNHFRIIDKRIWDDSIQPDELVFDNYYFTLTPNEFTTLCSTDLKNILIIDVLIDLIV